MKKWLLCTLLACCGLQIVHGQYKGNGYWHRERVADHGDTITHIYILPVYVFSRKVDLRRYRKLVEAVKKVYPVARAARARMDEMEAELTRLSTKKARKAYIRSVYDQIREEYAPVLKKMTRTQGRVLLKLIDRETEYTAYQILREFRGGFVAGFWQGMSRLFGQDLKSQYDKEGDDRMIEQIVVYYEAGLL